MNANNKNLAAAAYLASLGEYNIKELISIIVPFWSKKLGLTPAELFTISDEDLYERINNARQDSWTEEEAQLINGYQTFCDLRNEYDGGVPAEYNRLTAGAHGQVLPMYANDNRNSDAANETYDDRNVGYATPTYENTYDQENNDYQDGKNYGELGQLLLDVATQRREKKQQLFERKFNTCLIELDALEKEVAEMKSSMNLTTNRQSRQNLKPPKYHAQTYANNDEAKIATLIKIVKKLKERLDYGFPTGGDEISQQNIARARTEINNLYSYYKHRLHLLLKQRKELEARRTISHYSM